MTEYKKGWKNTEKYFIALALLFMVITVFFINPTLLVGVNETVHSWFGPDGNMRGSSGYLFIYPCFNPLLGGGDNSMCPEDFCYKLGDVWVHHNSFSCVRRNILANDENKGYYCQSDFSEMCQSGSPCEGEGEGYSCEVPRRPVCVPGDEKCCKEVLDTSELRDYYSNWLCECESHGSFYQPEKECELGCSDDSCVGCVPNKRYCIGKDIYLCTSEGTKGPFQETCSGDCDGGVCVSSKTKIECVDDSGCTEVYGSGYRCMFLSAYESKCLPIEEYIGEEDKRAEEEQAVGEGAIIFLLILLIVGALLVVILVIILLFIKRRKEG